MPDNSRSGQLEDFLSDLIADGDPLIPLAITSTEDAKQIRAIQQPPWAPFDDSKATLRCWLVWQEVAGKPFGVAIRARYFNADRPAGRGFADWFKRLYEISEV